MHVLSSWLQGPVFPQPWWIWHSGCLIRCYPCCNLSFHLLLTSGFSPSSFLFSSYCPYLLGPYYLLLSAKASNLRQHLVLGWMWTKHIHSVFCILYFFFLCEILNCLSALRIPLAPCLILQQGFLLLPSCRKRTKDQLVCALVLVPVHSDDYVPALGARES